MDIRAFRGWRFCAGSSGDTSSFIAPPYDVLTREDKQNLLSVNERNIVAVDLPHVPPSSPGPEHVYQSAAETLSKWASDGTIQQDSSESIYVYVQTFRWGGQTYSRRAIICGIRITDLGQDVIPHEHTFSGPKADRLNLTQHTKTQLSPVFGVYEDTGDKVAKLLTEAATAPPQTHGQLQGVGHELWVLSDPRVISDIKNALRDVPVFIADGHHRYTTAMNYRDSLAAEGKIDGNHPANFAMFALVARNDPGLLVLPTHRIVRNLKPDFSIEKLRDAATEFSWRRCSVEDADLGNADLFLGKYGPGAIALMGAKPAEIWIGQLQQADAMVQAAPDQIDPWRRLGVAILHKLILDKALAPWRTDDLFIDYTPDGQSVLAACRSGRAPLGACLQSAPIEAIEQIALAGAFMPHKSTYFFPKLATGVVWKPLE